QIDVDAVDGIPVRRHELHAAGDHDAVAERARHRLMQTPLELLMQDADRAGLRVDELAFGVRDVRIGAIETADDEDLAARERNGRRVRARLRELTERGPGRRLRRHWRAGARARGYDESDDNSECGADDGPGHCAWRVLLPVGTFCVENHVTPSCTRSKAT